MTISGLRSMLFPLGALDARRTGLYFRFRVPLKRRALLVSGQSSPRSMYLYTVWRQRVQEKVVSGVFPSREQAAEGE